MNPRQQTPEEFKWLHDNTPETIWWLPDSRWRRVEIFKENEDEETPEDAWENDEVERGEE